MPYSCTVCGTPFNGHLVRSFHFLSKRYTPWRCTALMKCHLVPWFSKLVNSIGSPFSSPNIMALSFISEFMRHTSKSNPSLVYSKQQMLIKGQNWHAYMLKVKRSSLLTWTNSSSGRATVKFTWQRQQGTIDRSLKYKLCWRQDIICVTLKKKMYVLFQQN